MAKKDAVSKEKKEKKHFFKDFKTELKKVIWPTPKQLANNTMTVIALVLLTALIVFVLDFVFESMNTYGINKIRDAVTGINSNAVTNEVTNETTETTTDTNTATDTNTTTNEQTTNTEVAE